MALITLALLAYTTFSDSIFAHIHSTNPALIFPYLLAIDVFAIKPWQWFQLATAILTLILWLKACTVSLQINAAEKFANEYQYKPVGLMQILFRLRNLTTWCYLAIGLVFTLLYWPDIYHYLPEHWVTWLAAFFDSELPIRLGVEGQTLPEVIGQKIQGEIGEKSNKL
jgi:hypothetical protein